MEHPQAFEILSDKAKDYVIQLGLGLFKHCGFDRLEEEELIMRYNTNNIDGQMDTYKKIIDRLKKDKESRNNYHTEREEELRKQYESRLQTKGEILNDKNISLERQIETLTNKIMKGENSCRDNIRNEYENKYQERINEMKGLHSSEIDRINQENKLLEERLVPLLILTEKKSFNNSTEQGNYGEGLIDEIVEAGLPFDTKAEPIDSSQMGGSGDRIIKFSNGFILMIEVKNENTITKGDREQFLKHSQKDFEEKKCDISLFLSLRTQQIGPKIGQTIIPHYDNRMVYYGLDDEFNLLEKKAKIIKCIEEIYHRFNQTKEVVNDNITDHISIYNHCLENLNIQKIDCENIIKSNEKNLEEYKKKRTQIHQRLNGVYRDARNKNIKIDEKLIDKKLYIEDFIERIKQWKEEKSIVFKKEFRKKVIDEMDLAELDKMMIKDITLKDIQ